MTSTPTAPSSSYAVPPGSVVTGYDGLPPADVALDWAAREARALGRRLVVVEVAQVGHPVAAHDAADRVAERFPDLDVEARELRGDPTRVLAEVTGAAHLLVVGSRGTGALRGVPSDQVGSHVAGLARCPVVVVPDYRPGLVRHGVLAGVSVRREASAVLERAFAHADLHRLPLTIVHATRDTLGAPGEDRARWLAEAVGGFATLHPDVAVRTRVEEGRPARVLLRLAATMDLLVVGQHTTGDLNPFGHVRSTNADRSPCPVMVVPVDRDHHDRAGGQAQDRPGDRTHVADRPRP